MKKIALVLLVTVIAFNVSNAQKIDKYCKNVRTSVDKFSGITNIDSPLSLPIIFHKVIDGDLVIMYMSIKVIGSTVTTGRGLTILLGNDKRITRPNEKIDLDVNSSDQYEYSASIRLTKGEIELLKANTMTDVKLYIYTDELKEKHALSYRGHITCIDAKNN